MTERSPRKTFDPDRVISFLFSKKITPEEAAKALKKGYKSLNLSDEEAYERIRDQDRVFQEGSWGIAEEQILSWLSVTSSIEDLYEIPEEERLNINRITFEGEVTGQS